jgi:ATP-binding cassette subfamily B protein
VGVSGASGTGKSTLVSLLPRFYDPHDGQVLLDDVDIRNYDLGDLREQFAIVLQDTALVSTSIADNIAYGRPDATKEQIIAAAHLANAHHFIAQLPDGYETLVGERGARLSGGERQRVALARAFLRDAPILILDEPTSAVDTATEAVVLDALNRLIEGRIAFIISHRPGTLDSCDLILQLDRGSAELRGKTAQAGRIPTSSAVMDLAPSATS